MPLSPGQRTYDLGDQAPHCPGSSDRGAHPRPRLRHAPRRHPGSAVRNPTNVRRKTEKYVIVGVLTLCVGFLPVLITLWWKTSATPLALGIIFTIPAGGGIALVYLLYRLFVDGSAWPLLVTIPWIFVVGPLLGTFFLDGGKTLYGTIALGSTGLTIAILGWNAWR